MIRDGVSKAVTNSFKRVGVRMPEMAESNELVFGRGDELVKRQGTCSELNYQ